MKRKWGKLQPLFLRAAGVRSPAQAKSGLLVLWLPFCEEAVQSGYVMPGKLLLG